MCVCVRACVWLQTHNRHPISLPRGQAMEMMYFRENWLHDSKTRHTVNWVAMMPTLSVSGGTAGCRYDSHPVPQVTTRLASWQLPVFSDSDYWIRVIFCRRVEFRAAVGVCGQLSFTVDLDVRPHGVQWRLHPITAHRRHLGAGHRHDRHQVYPEGGR